MDALALEFGRLLPGDAAVRRLVEAARLLVAVCRGEDDFGVVGIDDEVVDVEAGAVEAAESLPVGAAVAWCNLAVMVPSRRSGPAGSMTRSALRAIAVTSAHDALGVRVRVVVGRGGCGRRKGRGEHRREREQQKESGEFVHHSYHCRGFQDLYIVIARRAAGA